MAIVVHSLIFVIAAGIIWFFSGLLIESVDRIAKRFHKKSFTVAFFILGFLTSISEISVTTNATLGQVPQVSVGNLVGASFVILLFIIPVLAIAGKGVELKDTLSRGNLLAALGIIALPSVLVIDGTVSRSEGLLALLTYFILLYLIRNEGSPMKEVSTLGKELVGKQETLWDISKIIFGAGLIFGAGHYLVEQAVYFADLLSVPRSLIGLILLSIGTNIPELAITLRSVLKRHKDVAFGDYLGSAVANTAIFGLLALINGSFSVEPREFIFTMLLMIAGFTCFFLFARSKNKISQKEGLSLLIFYAAFLITQCFNLVQFAVD